MWLRVSPSDSTEARDPMKTCKQILGYTKSVATMNCHNATDWIDENRILAQIHGGKLDILMRMMRGRPFFCWKIDTI